MKKELKFQNLNRHYFLNLPSKASTNKKPILFVLHGGGGTAKRTAKIKSDFNLLSESDNFLIVYPQGVDKHWRDGRDFLKLWKYRHFAKNVDDVAFIKEIAKQLSKSNNGDLDNIFLTGISNGAMMSYKVACSELPLLLELLL